ncbi:MAG: hypothetical protein L0207_03540 [Chlamydiae bacterium]|nr:hypothetical protein [Chlamydiota bacterium]
MRSCIWPKRAASIIPKSSKNLLGGIFKCPLKLFLFIFAFIAVERFCHFQTKGFQIHKIQSSLNVSPSWEVEKENLPELQTILDQPFYFLGKGGQCYSFVSADKTWVIKFFKHHHMRPKSWLKFIPLPFFLEPIRQKIIRQKEKRLHGTFQSFKIANDFLKEQTGLCFLHLNKTPNLFNKPLKIVDRIGIAHFIDLDQTEFALQKKVSLAYPTIKKLVRAGEVDRAKRCLHSLLELISFRSKIGIRNRDPTIKSNFGFIDEKAIEIDLGSFERDEFMKRPVIYKRELLFETIRLKKWIRSHAPELTSFLNQSISDLLSS